jgi:hypothetical protein
VRAYAIGPQNDTLTITGLQNGTTYTSFKLPTPIMDVSLTNTFVRTWNVYAFDSSKTIINDSWVGEIGSYGNVCSISGSNNVVDGTGGYFFAAGTSTNYANGTTVISRVRSEKAGTLVFAYSKQYGDLGAYSIDSSRLFCVQSQLPLKPLVYDRACTWMLYIDTIGFKSGNLILKGSAFIDIGAQSPWADFQKYRIDYRKNGTSPWNALTPFMTSEVDADTLASIAADLPPDIYDFRLVLFDSGTDSIDAIKTFYVPQFAPIDVNKPTNDDIYIYPNPSTGIIYIPNISKEAVIEVLDITGKLIYNDKQNETGTYTFDLGTIPDGYYRIIIKTASIILNFPLIIQK